MRQADAQSLYYVEGYLMPRTKQMVADRLPQ